MRPIYPFGYMTDDVFPSSYFTWRKDFSLSFSIPPLRLNLLVLVLVLALPVLPSTERIPVLSDSGFYAGHSLLYTLKIVLICPFFTFLQVRLLHNLSVLRLMVRGMMLRHVTLQNCRAHDNDVINEGDVCKRSVDTFDRRNETRCKVWKNTSSSQKRPLLPQQQPVGPA